MTNSDPLIQILVNRINALEARLNRLQNNSVRSEITGALSRITFAELPTAGIQGRLFYITDVQSGIVYYDNGSAWVALAGSQIAFAVGDPGNFVNPGTIMTGALEVPTADPGWATCATVNMTPPNAYLMFRHDGSKYSIPGWST